MVEGRHLPVIADALSVNMSDGEIICEEFGRADLSRQA